MKKILYYGYFGPYLPHHCYFFKDPVFLARLGELGYTMTVCDVPDVDIREVRDVDWVIFNEAGSTGIRFGVASNVKGIVRRLINRPGMPEKMRLWPEMSEAGLRHKGVLLLHECIANIPENFYPAVHRLFDTILTNNDAYVDNKRFFLWRLPTGDSWSEVPDVPFGKKKLMICALTNNYTLNKFHLGKLRREEIKYFETRWPQQFDLFGKNWNKAVTPWQRLFPFLVPHYQSHRGYLDERDKAVALSKYRFNLCYENCSVQPGWISNRLFDSFRSKCVPVYLGGSNVAEVVDAGAFVDRRAFKSPNELADYLESVTESEYNDYQEAMSRFVMGERFKPFLVSSLAETIASVLNTKRESV